MEKYIPDIYQKSIYTIDYQKLINRGIKCLLFDLDNTLVPASAKEVNNKLKDLFEELKSQGFKVIIFSNSPKKRVVSFKEKLDVECCYNARKPFKKKFLSVIDSFGYEVSEVAIIGDQLLTDILGGNNVGITTILINPVSIKDGIQTKLNRKIEKLIMRNLRKRNLFIQGRYYE